MDLTFSPELEAYRNHVREWFLTNLPDGWGTPEFEMPKGEARKKFWRDWEKKLYEGGMNGITWPKEYGGQGLSQLHQIIYYEEIFTISAVDCTIALWT